MTREKLISHMMQALEDSGRFQVRGSHKLSALRHRDYLWLKEYYLRLA